MSALDGLLLAILGVSALTGLLRGFIGVIASLAAWVLGGSVALLLGSGAAQAIASGPAPTRLEMVAGYALCFVATSLLVAIAAFTARRALRAAGLETVDRVLGLALGGVRGIAMACAVVLLLGFTPLPRQRPWQASALVPVFKPGARWLSSWLPVGLRAHLDLDGTAPAGNFPELPPLPQLPA